MKKILSFLFVGSMVLSLMACGSNESADNSSENSTTQDSTTQESTSKGMSAKEEFEMERDMDYYYPDSSMMIHFSHQGLQGDLYGPDNYETYIEEVQTLANNNGKSFEDTQVCPELYWQEGYTFREYLVKIYNISGQDLNIDNFLRARLQIVDKNNNIQDEIIGDIGTGYATINSDGLKNIKCDGILTCIHLCFNISPDYFEYRDGTVELGGEVKEYTKYELKEGYRLIVYLDIKEDTSSWDSEFSKSDSFVTYHLKN